MKHLIFDCIKEMQPCGLRAVAKQLDADYDEVKELAEQLVTDGKLIKQSNQQFKVASGKGSTPNASHAWRKPVKDKVPEASDEDVEEQVRKAGGKWNHGNLVIMVGKRGVYRHQFEAKADELFSSWQSIADPKPSFDCWLKMPEPRGRTVREMIDDGLLCEPKVDLTPATLDTATTDELIEAVKHGKQAAEIIKQRLAEVGL